MITEFQNELRIYCFFLKDSTKFLCLLVISMPNKCKINRKKNIFIIHTSPFHNFKSSKLNTNISAVFSVHARRIRNVSLLFTETFTNAITSEQTTFSWQKHNPLDLIVLNVAIFNIRTHNREN